VVSGAVELRWSSPVAADRYRVRVRDASDRVVYETDVREEHVSLSPDVRARLRPGQTYSWSVEGLDAAGEVVVRSRPATFTVAP
jgi:hypothetical protein